MGKEIITFGDSPIPTYEINVDRTVVSNRVLFGKKVSNISKRMKCFIYGKKVRPLYIMLPQMSAYKRDFDGTKYVSF